MTTETSIDSEPIQAYIDIMLYRQSWLRLDWFGSPPEGQACYGEFDAEAPAGWAYKSWIPGQAIALETSVGELVSASDRTDLRGCIDFLLLVTPQEWAQVSAADGTPGNLMAATITAQTRGDVPAVAAAHPDHQARLGGSLHGHRARQECI